MRYFESNEAKLTKCGVVEIDENDKIIGMEEKPETKKYFGVMYGPLVLARDARLTEVGTSVPIPDTARLTRAENQKIDCLFCADLPAGDKTIRLIDYGSAGKTWSDDSLTEAWIKTG